MQDTDLNAVLGEIIENQPQDKAYEFKRANSMGFPKAGHRSQFKSFGSFPTPMSRDSSTTNNEILNEIQTKLDPQIIEMLKKRGKEKYSKENECITSNNDHIKNHTAFDESQMNLEKEYISKYQFDSNGNVQVNSHDAHESCHHGHSSHTIHITSDFLSLNEWIKLTRSVALETRYKALYVLHKIVSKSTQNEYSKELDLDLEFRKCQIYLHLRICMDSKENICYLAITILSMLIKWNENQDRLHDEVFYTGQVYPLFASSTINHSCFTLKVQGASLPNIESFMNEPDNIKEIENLMEKDVIQGLLTTNIVTRLQYLIAKGVPDDVLQDILLILQRVARHSKEASRNCLNNAKNWLSKCFVLPNPIHFLRFARDACCGSRENAMEFVSNGGLEYLFRLISNLQSTVESCLAWNCLSIITFYSIGILETREYRPLFFSKASSLFSFSKNEYELKCRIGLLKTLDNFIHATYLEYEMGGSGDEMKPFVDLILSLFPFEMTTLNGYDLASLSCVLNFINSYLYRVKATPSSKDLCTLVSRRIQSCLCSIFEQISNIDSLFKVPHIQENQNYLVSLLDFLTSYLKLTCTLDTLYGINHTLDPLFDSVCNLCLEQEFSIHSRSRYYHDSAKMRFLDAFLKVQSESTTLSEQLCKKNCQVVFKIFDLLLPGDEYLISKHLFKYIFNSKGRTPSQASARRMLLDIYDSHMYDDECLKASAHVYKRNTKEIQGCMMQVSTKGLPLPRNWIYSPLDLFLNEEKNQIHMCWDDMRACLLELLDVLELYHECMSGRDALGKVFKLFLLTSAEEKEFYQDDDIQIKLENVIMTFSLRIEEALLDKSRFYELYLECLDQYAATSFGNKTFGKYVILLLGVQYPKDYRLSFWTVLEPCLALFTHSVQELPGGIDFYLGHEMDAQLLKVYKRAISSGKINLIRNPGLYTIASYHLNQLNA